MHQRADHLSCLMHGESPKGIDDDLTHAYLFNVEMIPKWSEQYVPLMTIGQFNNSLPLREKWALIQEIASLKMLAGHFYKEGQDSVLRLCIELFEKAHYLEIAHVAVGNIHMAGNQTPLTNPLGRGLVAYI